MKIRHRFVFFFAFVLLLVLAGGITQAQGPASPPEDVGTMSTTLDEAAVSPIIPIQGRLTDNHGRPINGTRSVRFALYTASSGGTPLCVDTDWVIFANGLFNAYINFCDSNDINGQQLYLGIKVSSDPEMTPRKAIYPVPYAYGLKPGAVISAAQDNVLTVRSTGTGDADAIKGYGNGTGEGVTGNATAGSGVYGQSSSGAGVTGYSSSGTALNATGTGKIQSSARSYLFVPGTAFVKNDSHDSTRWQMWGGAARIYRGSTTGSKYVRIPVTIPAVLYGQPVRVTQVRVYYRCQNGTHNYIDRTYLYKMTDADSWQLLINSTSNHTSNTATSYLMTTNNTYNTLSADRGILTFLLYLHFENDTEYILIGGVRLTLEHD